MRPNFWLKSFLSAYDDMVKGKLVLLFAALLFLPVAIPVSAQLSISEHLIVFNGSNWGPVVSDKKTVLEAALVDSITLQLLRKYAFNTTVEVKSLSADGELKAQVEVQQLVLSTAPTPDLQDVWGPEEVNSMITRSNFQAVLALYPGPGKAVLVSVYVPENGKSDRGPTIIFWSMIFMGSVVGALMLITFAVVACCTCCIYAKR
ncbi:hypothetical protein ECC02_012865 [Trypanosoma cruzi]|nr:hypothetical protein ECC02_012865 [Trypanosoma cruzi]